MTSKPPPNSGTSPSSGSASLTRSRSSGFGNPLSATMASLSSEPSLSASTMSSATPSSPSSLYLLSKIPSLPNSASSPSIKQSSSLQSAPPLQKRDNHLQEFNRDQDNESSKRIHTDRSRQDRPGVKPTIQFIRKGAESKGQFLKALVNQYDLSSMDDSNGNERSESGTEESNASHLSSYSSDTPASEIDDSKSDSYSEGLDEKERRASSAFDDSLQLSISLSPIPKNRGLESPISRIPSKQSNLPSVGKIAASPRIPSLPQSQSNPLSAVSSTPTLTSLPSTSSFAYPHTNFQDQLDLIKLSCDDVVINETLYMQYKQIPFEKQSVKEYVSCRVYEALKQERTESVLTKKQSDSYREKSLLYENEIKRVTQEYEQAKRFHNSTQQEMQHEIQFLNNQRTHLQDELARWKMERNDLLSKGEQYDRVYNRLQEVEKDFANCSQRELMNSLTMKSLVEEKESMLGKWNDIEKKSEMLQMDKLYLQKEHESLTNKMHLIEKENQRLNDEMIEVRKSREELVNKVAAIRSEQSVLYETRLQEEMRNVSKRTEMEIETLRTTQRETVERELRSLRESRDDAVSEAERNSLALQNLREQYGKLSEEVQRLNHRLEKERVESRAEIQLKQFEYERIGLTLEETLHEFRQLKSDYELNVKKYRMLTKEFEEMKSSTKHTVERLETDNRTLTNKLADFTQLETELDLAIFSVAANAVPSLSGDDAKESKSNDGVENDLQSLTPLPMQGLEKLFSTLGKSLPSSNRRRMKQSILLAQKLVEKHRLNEVLSKELSEIKENYTKTKEELDALKKSYENISQPQHFIVKLLQNKENELQELQKQIIALERNDKELRIQNATNEKLIKDLQKDMQTLLIQRKNFHSLRLALENVKTSIINNSSVSIPLNPNQREPQPQLRYSSNRGVSSKPTISLSTSEKARTFGTNMPLNKFEAVDQEAPSWFKKLNNANR